MPSESKTTPCKYGEKCFRKDPGHLAQFTHPKKVEKKTADKEGAGEPVKPSLKRKKTHELSITYDDDNVDEPPAKKTKPSSEEEPMDTDKKGKGDKPSPKKAAAKSPGKKRVKCKYWNTCYRKDEDHKQTFVHPGDDDEDEADDAPPVPTLAKKSSFRVKPEKHLDEGYTVNTPEGFVLKRQGSEYMCNCQNWKKQEDVAAKKRTCKHLKAYLGEEFENVRCGIMDPEAAKKKAARVPQHISVSVLLAHKYEGSGVDPKGWWMSEKLDGVRAFWNGRCFYSRLGNAFYAPHWFTKDLPNDMHLDGELFGGRKKFQTTVKIVKNPGHPDWNKIKYHVFDAPHLEKNPFEKRMEELKTFFDSKKPQYAVLCEQTKCTGKEQVDKELKRVIAHGGEGLMIRKPGSKYERTRSHTLLKIKKFHDAEARVIGYEKSKSNNSLTGALWVEMACGKQFKVGSGLTNKDRRSPPKKGTIITYKFQELTNSGTPRFPTYVGIRIDMTEPKDATDVVTTATDD